MRIAYLAAGAGGMYCGSCLHDNRLAASLLAKGHDVVLLPLFTPIRTDEVDVSQRRVHYGGINVFLAQQSAFFRSLPSWLSRILDARSVLRFVTHFAGDSRPDRLGPLTVSVLRGANGAQRRELRSLVQALRELGPDLVHLPDLMFIGLARELKATLGVPVVCGLTGEDIFLDQLPLLFRTQAFDLIREHAEAVDGFVALTNYYAGHAAEHFSLPRDRIHVVPMGVRTDDVGESADPAAQPFTIGYLARVCPEKGLANLCNALTGLRRAGRNCRVRAAGYLAPSDRVYLERIIAQLREQNAADAFEYIGEVSRPAKLAFLRSLHAFSLPTVYQEAKGLSILEAMACGVPIVQPRHGSFPELIEATGGGLLYDTATPQALADTLAQLMDDAGLRVQLAQSGRQAVHRLFTSEVMADRTWSLYHLICAQTVT